MAQPRPPRRPTADEPDIWTRVSEVAPDVDSEVHVLARDTSRAAHPTPMTHFVAVEEADAGVLTLRLPRDRPATQLENQGRHISAYALMAQALLSRVEGVELNEGVRLIGVMLEEYIADASLLRSHRDSVATAEHAAAPRMVAREQRLRIEMALRSARRFFEDAEVAGVFARAPTRRDRAYQHAQQRYFADKAAMAEVKDEDIRLVRTSLKRSGELEPYRDVISAAITNALKLLNKMDDVAFTERRTHARSGEGSGIATALQYLLATPRLGAGENYTASSWVSLGENVAELFDYPAAEFALEIGRDKDAAASKCRNLIRRHVKLVFDACPNLRPVFNDTAKLKQLLDPLLTKVRVEFAWGRVSDDLDSFQDNDTLFGLVKGYLIISDSHCLFEGDHRKFRARRPALGGTARSRQVRDAGARAAVARRASVMNQTLPVGGATPSGGSAPT